MHTGDKVKYSQFIRESNAIEGIYRIPLDTEIEECNRFVHLKEITVNDLNKFVKVYQPNAVLRNKKGLDVTVGGFIPVDGGSDLVNRLKDLLKDIQFPAHNKRPLTPYEAHLKYETLHPYTDCNGRSGRMLWYWMMKGNAPLNFLHTFYYQCLKEHHG